MSALDPTVTEDSTKVLLEVLADPQTGKVVPLVLLTDSSLALGLVGATKDIPLPEMVVVVVKEVIRPWEVEVAKTVKELILILVEEALVVVVKEDILPEEAFKEVILQPQEGVQGDKKGTLLLEEVPVVEVEEVILQEVV